MVLLDPTKPGDPNLLWFNQVGEATPSDPDFERWNYRAKCSIHFFHLNHPITVQSRKRLISRLGRKVRSGQKYYMRLSEHDLEVQHAFDEVVTELREAIRSEAQFSAAARAYLQGRADSEHKWIPSVLSSS